MPLGPRADHIEQLSCLDLRLDWIGINDLIPVRYVASQETKADHGVVFLTLHSMACADDDTRRVLEYLSQVLYFGRRVVAEIREARLRLLKKKLMGLEQFREELDLNLQRIYKSRKGASEIAEAICFGRRDGICQTQKPAGATSHT